MYKRTFPKGCQNAYEKRYPSQPQQYPQSYGNPNAPRYPNPPAQQYPAQPPTYNQYPSTPQQPSAWHSRYYSMLNQQEVQNLQAWFTAVDRDRSGSISAIELAAMPLGNGQLGLETAQKLIKAFDKDYSGSIEFHEYAALNKFIGQMQAAFYAADADRSGKLTNQEIYNALSTAGFQVSFPTIQTICSKYDAGSGLSLNSFIQICAQLAAVRSIFEYNDPSRTGKVTLTYDQLSMITVHLMDRTPSHYN